MRYFEKVFDGQVLKWCVNGAELGGGKSTLLCLVSNDERLNFQNIGMGTCIHIHDPDILSRVAYLDVVYRQLHQGAISLNHAFS